MVCLKVLENTSGLMELNTGEILSRVTEMGMDIGNQHKNSKVLKVIIYWIENMDMDNIVGVQDSFIRGFTLRTLEVDMVN